MSLNELQSITNLSINVGGIYVDKSRNMSNITGNNFGDNTNFQGDNVKQNVSKLTDEVRQLFNDLVVEINKMLESQEKIDSLEDVRIAQKAFTEGNKERAIKFLKSLPEHVKNINAFITLFNFVSTFNNPPC